MNRATKFSIGIALIGIFILAGVTLAQDDPVKEVGNIGALSTNIILKEKVFSIYSGIDLHLKREETEKYQINILLPITKSEVVNKKILEWIDAEKRGFLTNISIDKNYGKSSFDLALTIEEESDQYDKFIFFLQKRENEASFKEKTFNIDFTTERFLTINDFLDINEDTLNTLMNQALNSIEEQENISIKDETKKYIIESEENWDWYMDKKGLSFIFDSKMILENKPMPLAASIPLEDLYLLTQDNLTDYIDLSDVQRQERENAIKKEKERILIVKQEQENREREAAEAKRKAEEAQAQRLKEEKEAARLAEAKREEAKEEVVADVPKKPATKPSGKYVALTFDDGPNSKTTPIVLDILRQYNAKATFFMVGPQVSSYPTVAKQVADSGHEIGNHTERHQDLTKLGPSAIQQEIAITRDKIIAATGVRPYLVRPPYGAYNKDVINSVANNGESIALWSVDSLDWQSRNAIAINNQINKSITSGSIVLMHDIHATTVDALPQLMKTLHDSGYEFVTISQLLEKQGRSGTGPFYGN